MLTASQNAAVSLLCSRRTRIWAGCFPIWKGMFFVLSRKVFRMFFDIPEACPQTLLFKSAETSWWSKSGIVGEECLTGILILKLKARAIAHHGSEPDC